MATPVQMPKMGQSVEECAILEWMKNVGDEVAAGDEICRIETDKATFEVEAPASGKIIAVFVPEGDIAPVLTNIAVIGADGESTDEFKPAPPSSVEERGCRAPQIEAHGGGNASPSAPQTKAHGEGSASAASGQAAASATSNVITIKKTKYDITLGLGRNVDEIAISPRAKKLAASRGVDIRRVDATGPMGRVIERDVKDAPVATPLARKLMEDGELVAGDAVTGRVTASDLMAADEEFEITEYRGVRKATGDRMLESVMNAPQFTVHMYADATAMLDARNQLRRGKRPDLPSDITVADMVHHELVKELVKFPEINALFDGKQVAKHKIVNLAVAVNTDNGLLVPVIRNAHRMSLMELSEATLEISRRCKERSVSADDMTGGTFTVSNLWMLGVDSFTAILNPPQVGILGVSGIHPRPKKVGREYQFVKHIGLSITVDHRIIDGAPAARFLKNVCDAVARFKLPEADEAVGAAPKLELPEEGK